jgi:hypothetical protein
MKKLLQNLTEKDRGSYILMKRIESIPVDTYLYIYGELKFIPTTQELGVYGVYLGDDENVYENLPVGYLLRR